MYKINPVLLFITRRERTFLDPYRMTIFSLSQYVKILCIVVPINRDTLAKPLKVVIAAGLTSSHPEQRS